MECPELEPELWIWALLVVAVAHYRDSSDFSVPMSSLSDGCVQGVGVERKRILPGRDRSMYGHVP